MGRLFTYMVKAAAGQQPAPYTGYYGVWGTRPGVRDTEANNLNSEFRTIPGTGVYGSLSGYTEQEKYDRANAIDRLFSASQNVDAWNALAGNDKTNWGADYLTAIDRRFTSPAAIYDVLSKNRDYLEAIRHLANTGSYDKLDELTSHDNRNNSNYVGLPYVRIDRLMGPRVGTDYDIADGVGNAQLVINNYLAEEARRKAEEEARRKAEEEADQQTPNAESANVQATSPHEGQSVAPPIVGYKPGDSDGSIRDAYHSMFTPSSAAPTPVQAPTIPDGTHGNGQGSSNSAAPAPVQAPPISGTWNAPSFTQPSSGISFYNLPPGMTQEQAQQKWNATGRAAAEAYLAATGRRGENIQVSPDGSTIRLRNSRGGYTELNTALPATPQEKFDVNQITPAMRARSAQDPAMQRGLIAMQGANGRVHRAPANSLSRRSRPSATAAPAHRRVRWADISVDTDNYGAFERAYAHLMHRRTGGGYAQQGWQQQAADWGNRQYTNWQHVQGKNLAQMSDNERRWYNAVHKDENRILNSALQAREAEERRNATSSSQGARVVQPPANVRGQARPVMPRA